MKRRGRALCGVTVAVMLASTPASSEPEAASAEGAKEAPKATGSDLVGRASTELSLYSDTDAVTVTTPTIAGSVENPISGWAVNGRYLVDVVTAASVDIVATASRSWREVRHEGTLDAKLDRGDLGFGASGSFSAEPDYVAFAAGARASMDFAEKNVTTLLAYTLGHDTIGRHRTTFDVFSHTLTTHTVNAGLTVIVNRSTLLALVTDVIVESGDSSKPYRYVPMFAHGVADRVPVGASFDVVNAKREPERPLEQLPTSRFRFALTGRIAHRFTSSTLRVEERFYRDDWGLTGTTTDVQPIFDLGRRVSFWPHGRLHLQAPVAFWRRAYEVSFTPTGKWTVPALRTGDRELGPLRSLTGGGGLRFNIGPDEDPKAWVLGVRGDVIWTKFLDDLYVTDRVSGFTALSLETTFE